MEVAASTAEALMRDAWLWIGLLVLVLVFVLYIQFKPHVMEFFTASAGPAGPTQPTQPADPTKKNPPSQ